MQVHNYNANYGKSPGTVRQPVRNLDKDAFLQLFVEQLKNQDPMSPQDSNAFMAQMAQFSILEQITNLNKEVVQLRQSQELSEASALLDRQVKIQSGEDIFSGQVEKVAVLNGDVQVFIDGKGYNLTQVIEVR